jgi:cytochrome c-type biogenesis protein CcmH
LLLAALLLATVAFAQAREAAPVAEDPVLEQRVMKLSETLRCLVCQNQTIADSHADLAIDLKNQVREMLKAGKTDKEVLDFMTQRYGDFVLYKPPVKPTTWVLWIGPFVLLAIGLAVLFFKLRKRQQTLREASLSDAEHAQAQALLADGDERRTP